MSIYEICDHPEHEYRLMQVVLKIDKKNPLDGEKNWTGEVVEIASDGKLKVNWIGGETGLVTCKDILILESEDESDYEDDDSDDDSWETVSESGDEELIPESDKDARDSDPEEATQNDSKVQEEAIDKLNQAIRIVDIEGEDIESFEILEAAPVDHYFYEEKNDGVKSDFISAIRREHNLLAKSLPPDIYGRAYEDRMDLFRFLVIGPNATPYENCMFVFDIKLDSDYPNSPPKVFYHCMTGGLGQLNPNLYEDGHICLSLLGTWKGKGSERWSSESSNLLQLMISISGLVLVREPFFNEAGYEKFVGSEEGLVNSIRYNETAFLLSVQSIENIIRHPPVPFAPFIKHYYFEKGGRERVFARCQTFQEASSTTSSDDDIVTWHESDGRKFPLKRISKGCQKLLDKILARLSDK